MIQIYQRKEPSIIAKYKYCTYYKGSFCGGSNICINLITCKDDIVIPSTLWSYVLHYYHTYIFHPEMDRTEAMICQHFYWPVIRDYVQKKVYNCDTFQGTKWSNKKYGELPAKLDD